MLHENCCPGSEKSISRSRSIPCSITAALHFPPRKSTWILIHDPSTALVSLITPSLLLLPGGPTQGRASRRGAARGRGLSSPLPPQLPGIQHTLLVVLSPLRLEETSTTKKKRGDDRERERERIFSKSRRNHRRIEINLSLFFTAVFRTPPPPPFLRVYLHSQTLG